MPLSVSRENAVTILRLEWQERRNALRPEDANEIRDAINAETEATAIVLCGSTQAFCAGADLRRIQELAAGGEDVIRNNIYRSFQGMVRAIRGFAGVVISAVDGPALGLGADLALACDVCYVGPAGWIDQGWARIGAVPGIGGAYVTSQRAGRTVAWEFMLSQRRWTGEELERVGLAMAAPDGAEVIARQRAEWLADYPPDLARAYKSLIGHSEEESFDVHLERAGAYQAKLRSWDAYAKRLPGVIHDADGATAGSTEPAHAT